MFITHPYPTHPHKHPCATQTYCIVPLWSIKVRGSAKRGHECGDKKKEHPPHYLPHSQSANTKHRSEEKKGNYNRQEEEKQQFWQSCVDNFPGADLAKEATSVELQRQLLGCSGCFSSDVLQSTFLCRRSNLVCSAPCEDTLPGTSQPLSSGPWLETQQKWKYEMWIKISWILFVCWQFYMCIGVSHFLLWKNLWIG